MSSCTQSQDSCSSDVLQSSWSEKQCNNTEEIHNNLAQMMNQRHHYPVTIFYQHQKTGNLRVQNFIYLLRSFNNRIFHGNNNCSPSESSWASCALLPTKGRQKYYVMTVVEVKENPGLILSNTVYLKCRNKHLWLD